MADLGRRRGAALVVGVAVVASVLAATSRPSAAASFPGAPTITNATAGNTAIALTFTPPANNGGSPITGYTASCTSANGGAAGSTSGGGSPIVVNALTNGRTYTCTVTATSALGSGAPSEPAGPLIPKTVPGAPTIGAVAVRNLSLGVSFAPPADDGGSVITSYTASCTSSNGGAPGSAIGSDSPIVVNGLTNGRVYRCAVRAANAAGTGAPSGLSGTATPGPTAPDPPTITETVGGNTALAVTFARPANNGGSAITSYTASCQSATGGTDGTASAAGSPIVVNGLTNGRFYTCVVTATNARGTSGPSQPSDATFVGTVPGPPTIAEVTSRNLSLRVAFSGPAGDGGSVVSRYTATCTSSNGGASGSATGPVSPIVVNGLTNGRTYRCTVTATNALGTGPPSAPSAGAIPAVTVPDAPALTVVFVHRTALTIAFSTPANDGGSPISTFTASCASPDGGTARTRAGAKSPISVKGLTSGKRYSCTVTASNATGISEPSGTTRPAIVGAPQSPVSVVATPAPGAIGSVTVKYTPRSDNGSKVDRFSAICLSYDGGVARGGSHNGSNPKPIKITGMTTGRSYGCWVLAHNARGYSLPSRVAGPFTVGV